MPDEVQHFTYTNPQSDASSEATAAMAQRWDGHIERMTRLQSLRRLLEPSSEEREARKKLRDALISNAGIDDGLITRAREQAQRRRDQLNSELNDLAREFLTPPHPVLDMPGAGADGDDGAQGWFWWARTNWSWNHPGIVPFWDAVTGFCFAGSIHVNSGSLQRRFLTVQAQFDLPATRIPASLHGNVFSLTRADTQGLVHGAVWGDMFSFGDQWSKCWMNVRQTIFAQIPGMVWPFNGFLPIASNATSFNLLDLDDHIQVGTNRLPGLIAMPIVGFPVGPGVNLQAVLEFWFDIQMEGDDSNMTFGFEPPSFSNMVQTFQWKLSKM